MPKIRVLVVDDSVVIRRLLSDELNKDTEIEVVGTASNGQLAIQRLTQLQPELVTLDVEMPEMDGLQCLEQLRKTHPRLPVIMFSSLTERGAMATIKALMLGASDYFTKPSGSSGMDGALKVAREQLIPKIKTLVRRSAPAAVLPSARRPNLTVAPVQVVAIGCSTGGPNALADIFPRFPAHFPVPIVVVQHMPPVFTKLLAERLTAKSAVPVHEAAPGMTVQAGHAYIAPGDYHMTLVRMGTSVRLQTNQDPPENSCRPAVDVLFRSVATVYGSGTLGVVLTGMGQDGLRGCQNIREAGGRIIAQDEASSVVWGMPGFVVRGELADHVLPLDQIGDKINQITRRTGS